MLYYFINQKRRKKGIGPDLPGGMGFALIAEPKPVCSWALYEVSDLAGKNLNRPQFKGVTPVPLKLEDWIEHAKAYPPALAIARDQIEAFGKKYPLSRKKFTEQFITFLRQHIQSQPTANYFLAEAVVDELGYKTKGQYYWIVGYEPESKNVHWVSLDYFVYSNPARDFKISQGQIKKLPKVK